jgi:hypothetical protein
MQVKGSVQFAAIAMLVLPAAVLLNAAQHRYGDTIIATGLLKDEIALQHHTRIGGATLDPGRYHVDHRIDTTAEPGAAHYVFFLKVTPEIFMRIKAARDFLGVLAVAPPGEIESKVEPLAVPPAETTLQTVVENGVRRITRIEFAGESVAHVF